MIQSLDTRSLNLFIVKQLNNFFPDSEIKLKIVMPFVEQALKRAEYCFSKVNNKYFFDGRHTYFNHLHTDQYAMFLYFLSNTIWEKSKDGKLAGKVYYLNKALNGLDVFYEVSLPDIFIFAHPVGAVLGRAAYKDYLVVYQRVTVGGNTKLEYPVLGRGIALYTGSALIGKCDVGDNCLISAGTIVMEKNIPSSMVVFGRSPDISYKKTTKSVIERYFII